MKLYVIRDKDTKEPFFNTAYHSIGGAKKSYNSTGHWIGKNWVRRDWETDCHNEEIALIYEWKPDGS